MATKEATEQPRAATHEGRPYDLYVYTVWTVELGDDGGTYDTDELVMEVPWDRRKAEQAAIRRGVETGRPHLVTERAFTSEEENDVLKTWQLSDQMHAAEESGYEAGHERGRDSLREELQTIIDSELDGPDTFEALEAVIGDMGDLRGESDKQLDIAKHFDPNPRSLVAAAVAEGGLRYKIWLNGEFHGSNADRLEAIIVAERLATTAEKLVTVEDTATGRTIYSCSGDPDPDTPPYHVKVNDELHAAFTSEADAVAEAEGLVEDAEANDMEREIVVMERPPGDRMIFHRKISGSQS